MCTSQNSGTQSSTIPPQNDPLPNENARTIINNFMELYSPDICRSLVWELLLYTLCSKEADNIDIAKRADFIRLGRDLDKLILAVFEI